MTIRLRLLLGLAAYAALALATAAATALASADLAAARRAGDLADDMLGDIAELGLLTHDYIHVPGPRPRDQWLAVHARLSRRLASDFPVAAGTSTHDALRQDTADLLVQFERLQVVGAATPGVPGNAERWLRSRMLVTLHDMAASGGELSRVCSACIARVRTRADLGVGAFLLLSTLGLLVFALAFARSVIGPLDELQAGVASIEAGDLSRRVGTGARDELGEFSRSFDAMIERLQQTMVARDVLDEAQVLLRAVLDGMGEGVVVADREGRFLLSNPAAKRLLGPTLPEGPLEGRAERHGLFEGPDETSTAPLDRLPMARALAGERVEGVDCYLRNDLHPDGLWVMVSASPVRGPKGELEGGVAVLRDISDRKEAELSRRLLREVHHRIKNNLQVVQSLLELQAQRIEDPRFAEVLRESRSRVRAIASLHEQLYRAPEATGLDFGAWLHRLVADLRHTHLIGAGRILLEVEAEPLVLGLDTSVPFGLIVHELVTNALKHAFPGELRGRVLVGLRGLPDGECELSVTDDGVGLPADLDVRRTGTLGLRLVDGLVGQIGGRLERETGRGTAVRIRFREPAGRGRSPVARPG